MSGDIWNHLPQMLSHFEEEGIPFPSFEEGQMANLVAFIHGGGTPPARAQEGAWLRPKTTRTRRRPRTRA